MSNILIFGPGRLGGQVAFQALMTGTVNKVFLVGHNYSKAQGVAQDLIEAFPEYDVIAIKGNEIPEPVQLSFFTFSSLQWSPNIGVNDRLIEAAANMKIVDKIAAEVDASMLGTIVVVSNPVDILTWHTALAFKTLDVLGFGISLDEHRMGPFVQRLTGIVCPRLSCIGEHGVNVIPLLSSVMDERQLSPELYNQVKTETFTHTEMIIKQASIPFYGPSWELRRILNTFLLLKSETLTMSRYLNEPLLNVRGVALGVPIVIEKGKPFGIANLIVTSLEAELFAKAAYAVAQQRESVS